MARAKGIPALELYRLAQKKKRKLVLCGHSLGGAVRIQASFAKVCCSFKFVLIRNDIMYYIYIYSVFVGCSFGYPSNFKGYFCFCFKGKR